MTVSVFLAYPLTTAGELEPLERFVDRLRHQLEGEGCRVLPKLGGLERIGPLNGRTSESDLLASNVTGVADSDVLVILVPTTEEPSSIWVELGIAIAARRSVVIVGPERARIPFLGRLLLSLGASERTGEPEAIRVVADIPPNAGVDTVVERVVAAVLSVGT